MIEEIIHTFKIYYDSQSIRTCLAEDPGGFIGNL